MGRSLLWSILLLCLAAAGVAAPLEEGLPVGERGVGWMVLQLTDPRRPLDDGRPRPMQVAVWYPARTEDRTPSVYGEYVDLLVGEKGVSDSTSFESGRQERVEPYLQFIEERGVAREAIDAWLGRAVMAYRDAPALSGPFPLVLLAQGNMHSIHNQAILAACLASHGFVVASAPAQGRITHPARSEDEVLPSAEEQADDLQFLLAHADLFPASDAERLGVLGYSFGGRSALLFQMQTGVAKAMVSLDSGIANVMGKGLLEKASYFAADGFTTPLLHVYQSGDAMVQPDFDLIESLVRSDRILIELGGMAHGHFGSFGWIGSHVEGFSALVPEADDVAASWTVMAGAVVSFFEATLKREDAASFEMPTATPVLSTRRLPAAN